jgi:hypothetical protein
MSRVLSLMVLQSVLASFLSSFSPTYIYAPLSIDLVAEVDTPGHTSAISPSPNILPVPRRNHGRNLGMDDLLGIGEC